MRTRTATTPVAVLSLAVALVGCSGGAYQYVKTVESFPAGKTDGLSAEEAAVETSLQAIAKAPIAVEFLSKMFKSAVIVFQDFDNLTFTAKLENGAWALTRGSDSTFRPDYVIPFSRQNVANLEAIVADGAISDEEAYRIHYVTFIPALRSFFRYDPLYNAYVARRMALPPLIHMTLKNPHKYQYHGTTHEISGTAANVNGQWLVFEGKVGDPDLSMEVTHDKAAEFSGLLFKEKPGDSPSRAEVDAQIDKVKAFIDSVVVYRKPKA